ncbi:MAG: hypothetical protein ACRDTJ_30865, partial [Pseudonocardiaceae bacterium]
PVTSAKKSSEVGVMVRSAGAKRAAVGAMGGSPLLIVILVGPENDAKGRHIPGSWTVNWSV